MPAASLRLVLASFPAGAARRRAAGLPDAYGDTPVHKAAYSNCGVSIEVLATLCAEPAAAAPAAGSVSEQPGVPNPLWLCNETNETPLHGETKHSHTLLSPLLLSPLSFLLSPRFSPVISFPSLLSPLSSLHLASLLSCHPFVPISTFSPSRLLFVLSLHSLSALSSRGFALSLSLSLSPSFSVFLPSLSTLFLSLPSLLSHLFSLLHPCSKTSMQHTCLGLHVQVYSPLRLAAWTILQHDGPNHLKLRWRSLGSKWP